MRVTSAACALKLDLLTLTNRILLCWELLRATVHVIKPEFLKHTVSSWLGVPSPTLGVDWYFSASGWSQRLQNYSHMSAAFLFFCVKWACTYSKSQPCQKKQSYVINSPCTIFYMYSSVFCLYFRWIHVRFVLLVLKSSRVDQNEWHVGFLDRREMVRWVGEKTMPVKERPSGPS